MDSWIFYQVLYDTNGFLEKNKDSLHADFLQLLSACNNELLQIASKLLNDSEKPATTLSGISSSDFPRQSVSTKFKVHMLVHNFEHDVCLLLYAFTNL